LGDIGSALGYLTYKIYLKEFITKHRLELLPFKTGKVGLCMILEKPLLEENLVPFYFPGTYSPKIVNQVKVLYLYHGEIDIPEIQDIGKDVLFKTPFWSFLKGVFLQK
jgi:hypothetical protein